MIKSVLIFMMVAMLMISCEHGGVYQPEEVDFANIAPFTSYEVPTKDGFVSIVTYGEDTLAITGIPMTINVPKYAVNSLTKASGGVTTQYSDDPKFEGYKNCGTIREDCVLMFEDTRDGDDDYNDLIIWVHKIERRSYWPDYTVSCEFTIHPIALGATKSFKLGVVNELGTEFILAENCREELFDGDKGFINTEANADPKVYPVKVVETGKWKYEQNSGNTTMNWFIETDNERMYIAETDETVNQSNMQEFGNDKGRPFGIAFPTTAASIFFYGGPFYATECMPIQKVYRNFEDWISGAWKNSLNAGGGKGVNNTDPAICFNISNPR